MILCRIVLLRSFCISDLLCVSVGDDIDAYDHSEERTRDEIGFEQDDIELNEKDFLLAFQEVIRLSRCAVQSWWTEDYRAKSESKIELIQEYFNKLKNKS